MTHGMAEIEIEIEIEMLKTEVERAEAKAHVFESEAIHNDEIMQSLAAEVTALRERIAELEAADQWRPVSEPPGKNGKYLVYDADSNRYMPPGYKLLPHFRVAEWHGRWESGMAGLIDYWRPLPTPPQEAPAP